MTSEVTITIRRLRTGSVFRIMAAGCFGFFVPFFVLMGVFGALGMNTLTWNNTPIHGVKALVAAPFMGVFAAALFAGFAGLAVAFGLWLYSKLRPLTLKVIQDASDVAAP